MIERIIKVEENDDGTRSVTGIIELDRARSRYNRRRAKRDLAQFYGYGRPHRFLYQIVDRDGRYLSGDRVTA